MRLLLNLGSMWVLFYDYAVIGTSPLGLIAANLFSALNKRVLLIGPSLVQPSSKYLALSKATWDFLEQHGYYTSQFYFEPIRSLVLGRPEKRGWRFFSQSKSLLGGNIRQDHFCQILWSLKKRSIEHDASFLKDVSRLSGQGYELRTEKGTYMANHLIAVDGAYSQVRLSLQTPWSFFKKSLSSAILFEISSCYEFELAAAYQYADSGCTLAILPHSKQTRYCVATGSEKRLQERYPTVKKIGLWNYQTQWDREDCAYLGWAGQSFDPNTASGLNHALWELQQLYHYWNTEPYSGKWSESWKKKIDQKRNAMRSAIASNQALLPAIHFASPFYVQTLLESIIGEALVRESCYCPRAIL